MKFKYPRTHHVPWSLGQTSDDKTLHSMDHFNKMEVVITLKMDGENTTVGKDYVHARSIDSKNHPSRNWIKSWAASTIQPYMGNNERICGENLYAQHSIPYENLKSYFYGFSWWNNDLCMDWDFTINYFNDMNIESVPVLYKGVYDENIIKNIVLDLEKDEGWVIRTTSSFFYNDFAKNVAKFVRKNHVTTDDHWMNKPITKNKLL